MLPGAHSGGAQPAARRSLAAVLAGAVAATALLYAVWLPRRPFSDEGSVCSLAQGMVRGKALYRDLANEKPPARYALTALFFALLGQGMPVVRLVPALALLLAVLCAGRLAATLAGSRRAGVAAGAALLLAAPGYQALHDVAETSLAVLVLAAATLLLSPPARLTGWRGRFLALGALLGLGLWFKQTFVWGALAFVAAPAARGRRAQIACGAALAWAIGFAAARFHSGSALIDETVIGPLAGVAAPGSGYSHWPTPVEALVFAIDLAFAAVVVLAARRKGLPGLVDLGWVASVLLLAALPRADVFRIWPSAPLLAVAAAAAAEGERRGRQGVALAAALGSWALLCAAARPPWAAETFRELDGIAAEVVRLSDPGDTIWVGPYEPNVYCLSRRLPAERHTFVLPWYLPPEARATLAETLRWAAPRVIVDMSVVVDGAELGLEELVPGIAELLAERYQRSATVNGAVLYTLCPDRAVGANSGPR